MALRPVRGVLVQENVQTGDGRVIASGALTWAPLPLPFAWLRDGDQHIDLTEMAPQIGNILTIDRDGDDVVWTGVVDDEIPDGAELVRRMENGSAGFGSRQGISIDPDNWEVELLLRPEEGEGDVVILAGAGQLPQLAPQRELVHAAAGDPDPGPEGGDSHELLFTDRVDDLLQRYTMLRIRGVTACAVPAFTGAYVELDGSAPAADTDEPEGDDEAEPDATTASAPARTAPVAPPAEVFHLPEPDLDADGGLDLYGMPAQELLVEQPDGGLAVPFTIVDRPDGHRVAFGHAARWGQCHVGYPGACVTAPESAAAYAHFHHGEVLCADGSRVATGTLTMGTDHAAAELRAPDARDHYANTGLAFADVRATNGALGVWVSGVIRPDVTEAQLRVIRASSLSGDWRRIGNGLEFIGALAVNVPGFPIAREAVTAAGLQQLPAAQLTASAWLDDGVQQSLVAAGVVQRCPECQQRAMAARAGAEPEVALSGEALDLLRKLELRTRHLAPAAAEHALARIRR